MQEQGDRNPSDGQQLSGADQAGRFIAPVQHSGFGKCPQCGGAHIRGRHRLFLVNLAACVFSVGLTAVLFSTGPEPLAFFPMLAVLLFLLALPTTTAIAVVGRNRCLDCGRRFEPGHSGAAGASLPRFRWLLHLLNIPVLVLLCVVGPRIMQVRAGAVASDMMKDVAALFLLGALLWGSLGCHVALHYTLRHRLTSPLVWAVLFLLPGVVGGGIVFYGSLPRFEIRSILRYAQLAPLPKSATGVRFYSWASPFSGEDFLRFSAEPNDIERFLAQSPALRGQEPKRYSAQRMRLEYSTDHSPWVHAGDTRDANEYIVPQGPHWYKHEIRGPARKYHVQPPRYQFPGEVLVDDETNTVYIYLCFS